MRLSVVLFWKRWKSSQEEKYHSFKKHISYFLTISWFLDFLSADHEMLYSYSEWLADQFEGHIVYLKKIGWLFHFLSADRENVILTLSMVSWSIWGAYCIFANSSKLTMKMWYSAWLADQFEVHIVYLKKSADFPFPVSWPWKCDINTQDG